MAISTKNEPNAFYGLNLSVNTGNSRAERPIPIAHPVEPGEILTDSIGLCCAFYGIGPLSMISTLAMGIIGALGVAGILSGVTVNALLITSGALTCIASLMLYALGKDRKEKILGIIGAVAALALIIFGAFGSTHIFSGSVVGIVGIVGSVSVIVGAAIYYQKFIINCK